MYSIFLEIVVVLFYFYSFYFLELTQVANKFCIFIKIQIKFMKIHKIYKKIEKYIYLFWGYNVTPVSLWKTAKHTRTIKGGYVIVQ